MRTRTHIFLSVLALWSVHGYGTETTVLPSKLYQFDLDDSRVYYELSCTDATNGAFLNCPFSVEITGLVAPADAVANNGGHSHTNAGRPLGQLQLNTVKSQRVTGSTGKGSVEVIQTADEVSGRIAVTFTVDSPPNYHCVASLEWKCITNSTSQSIETLLVAVPGLASLYGPAGGASIIKADGSTAPYIKVRGAASAVPHHNEDAFYGLPRTLETLEKIAALFKANMRRPLSVNDMSLPSGGKFDIFANWNADPQRHGEHRLGISADINSNGPSCKYDKWLKVAVDTVIPDIAPRYVNINAKNRTMSRLLCEETGNRHIDFDLPPLPTP